MALTSELIEVFSRSFGRPVNKELTDLSVEDRVLLGNILLEEAVEYAVKGLGLEVDIHCSPFNPKDEQYISIGISAEGDPGVDPIECADGLADVNVVIHFNAHWQGIPLDRATEIVNESNMSKLDENGEPIINGLVECFECLGRGGEHKGHEREWDRCSACGGKGKLIRDPNKPIGKILKGPNFWEPKEKLAALIGVKP